MKKKIIHWISWKKFLQSVNDKRRESRHLYQSHENLRTEAETCDESVEKALNTVNLIQFHSILGIDERQEVLSKSTYSNWDIFLSFSILHNFTYVYNF